MKINARKWSVVSLLLAASGLGLWALVAPQAGGTVQAAAPIPGLKGELPRSQTMSGGIPGKLEGRDAETRPSAPPFTTAPSPHNPLPSNPLSNPIFLPNTKANTDSTTYAQQEPSIAVNPINSLNIVASAKDERSAPGPNTSTKEVWEYTSTDGGLTWLNQHAPIVGTNAVHQSDPINIFRDDGRAYACYLGYSDTGGFTDTGIYVTQSTDGGITWGNTVLAVNEAGGYSNDKEWLAVDNNPSSPFYHRMYLSWTEFGVCSACIHFVYSTDSGLTWSPRTFQLSSGGNQQFSMPTVLSNGNLYINWAGGSTIFYRISTDGGVTFSAQATAGTMNTNLSMAGRNWRINAIPVAAADSSSPGNLVIVWNDGRNNATSGVDVYYIRSTNGGTTWTAPARLNDDPTGVVKHQAEPWVTTSPNGVFHALWYDAREDLGTGITFHIYYTQSTDAGATWSANVRASDATSNLNIGIPAGPGWNGAAGDYINITASNTDVYGAWTDTRNGTNEDIYVAHGVLGGGTPSPTVTGTPPTATPTSVCPPSFGGVQITDFTFTPITLTVYTGATVRWVNFGPTTHTSTSDTGVWDSGNLAMNEFYQRIFNTPGVYPYHCAIHPGMVGSVTVLAGCPPTSTPTRTSSATPTRTFTPVITNSPTNTPTSCVTVAPTNTFTPIGTVSATAIRTNTPTITNTPGSAGTATDTPTGGPSATAISTLTATPCALTFSDVATSDYFYAGVRWLYCHGAISGYNDNTFRPYNNTTRGQMVKIIVLAYGIPNYTPPSPTFNDVFITDPFYAYIETAAYNNIVSGYNCGGVGEPCPGVYFRPVNLVTRGQLSKIIVITAGWTLINPGTPTFNDAPRSNAFYTYIETAYCHAIISGYDCGSTGEPCPGKYFRPGNNATRGQISKIVYEATLNHPCGSAAAQGR